MSWRTAPHNGTPNSTHMRRWGFFRPIVHHLPMCLVFCLCAAQPLGSAAQGLIRRNPMDTGLDLRPTLLHRQQVQSARFGNTRSRSLFPLGTPGDSSGTTSPWRHGVFLGAQVIPSYPTICYERSIHRHRWGHGYSIGHERILFPISSEPFTRYTIPFQATVFRGRTHCWEMGMGLLFAHALQAEDFSNAYARGMGKWRYVFAESLWATWQPIGYRFDRSEGRFVLRIYPELAMNLWEFNKDWGTYLEESPGGFAVQWDMIPRFSFKLGWLFSLKHRP